MCRSDCNAAQVSTAVKVLSRLGRRRAGAADIKWLVDLRMATMSEYLETSGENLTEADQRTRVIYQFGNIDILTLDDAPVGMCKIIRGSSPWKLVQIQCLPSHQRLGIGSCVIRKLLAEATGAGCSVELSVLKVNPARALYERLGFRIVEEKAAAFRMRIEPR